MRKLFITIGAAAVTTLPIVASVAAKPVSERNTRHEIDLMAALNQIHDSYRLNKDLSKVTQDNFEANYKTEIIRLINASPIHEVELRYEFISQLNQRLLIRVSGTKNGRITSKMVVIFGQQSESTEEVQLPVKGEIEAQTQTPVIIEQPAIETFEKTVHKKMTQIDSIDTEDNIVSIEVEQPLVEPIEKTMIKKPFQVDLTTVETNQGVINVQEPLVEPFEKTMIKKPTFVDLSSTDSTDEIYSLGSSETTKGIDLFAMFNKKSFQSTKNSDVLENLIDLPYNQMKLSSIEEIFGIDLGISGSMNEMFAQIGITNSEKNDDFEGSAKLWVSMNLSIENIDGSINEVTIYIDSRDNMSYQSEVDNIYNKVIEQLVDTSIFTSNLKGNDIETIIEEAMESTTYVSLFNQLALYDMASKIFPTDKEAWSIYVRISFELVSIKHGETSGVSYTLRTIINKGTKSTPREIVFIVNSIDYE